MGVCIRTPRELAQVVLALEVCLGAICGCLERGSNQQIEDSLRDEVVSVGMTGRILTGG